MAVNETVALNFKANTKGAKRSLTSLAFSVNEIGAAAQKVGAGLRKAGEAVKFFAKTAQLEAAAAGADISRIQDAAQGLITQQEALSFAAAALNTEFKLNQQEMENVARFMIVLRNQGNDLATVQTRLTQAIVEGNSRALRPFGVIVDGTTGKLQTQKDILAEITKQNETYAGSLDLAGDAALRMAVKTEDATDRLKNAIGEGISDSIQWVEDLGDAWDSATDANLRWGVQTALVIEETFKQARLAALSPEQRAGIRAGRRGIGANIREFGSFGQRLGQRLGIGGAQAGQAASGGGRGGGGGGRAFVSGQTAQEQGLFGVSGGSQFSGNLGGTPGAGLGGVGTEGQFGLAGALGVGIPEAAEAGAIAVVDMRTEVEKLGEAMMVVGSAVTDSFEQWGSGAIGLGDALKGALGNSLGDILMGEAKAHLVRAAAEAAALNGVKAAGHLAAAALLAAGSGKVRSFLGGSGSSAGAGGGGGRLPGAAAGGFGGGRGVNSEVIFISDSDNDDPRETRRRQTRKLEKAEAQRGRGTAIIRA